MQPRPELSRWCHWKMQSVCLTKGWPPRFWLPLLTTHFKWRSVKDQNSSTHWLLRVCWLLYGEKYRSNLLVSLDRRKKVACSHRALIALRKGILPWQLWCVYINTHLLCFRVGCFFFSTTPPVFYQEGHLKSILYWCTNAVFTLKVMCGTIYLVKYILKANLHM